MKEFAVYGRTGPFDTSETAFYIPHLKVNLPEGNQRLKDDEVKALNYELSRQEASDQEFDNKFHDKADVALNKMKSEANRRIIETIYEMSSSNDVNLVEVKPTQTSGISSSDEKNISLEKQDKNELEDLSSIGSRTSKIKKKVPYEENPIFMSWKDRKTMAYDSPSTQSYRPMPPFPSNEYFVGLWKLVSSPISVDSFVGESTTENGLPSNENDTIILRVDGTTAGGPILDFEQNLKSVGGTWRSYQAVLNGRNDVENFNHDGSERTRLRIRLVIPPKKEKILVMEGEIQRVLRSSLLNQNIREIQRLSTFSFPYGESTRENTDTNLNENSFTISCSGEMWVETASPHKGLRKKLGRFTLVKMADLDPSQIRYSIPSNKPGYYQ